MLRRLLINEQPSFASIGYSYQQLSRVPLGTANRRSQFHCPKSKISKVWIALEEDKQGIGPYLRESNHGLVFTPLSKSRLM